MKLAFSNIAWDRALDGEAARLMSECGVRGLEIAPTALWPEPLRASSGEIREARSWWQDRGVEIVALQALLFGKPEYTLFETDERRHATLEHLTGMMDLGAALGAGVLVFGSPGNRLRGSLAREAAWNTATGFFREAGSRAADRGVRLCIEPNPTAYSCDFVTTTAEAAALVAEVASPGFGLHLDAGTVTINGESPLDLATAARNASHYHASEPFLVPLGTGGTDHHGCSRALRSAGYDRWVSVEMRPPPDGAAGLRRAMELLREHYGA